MPSVGGIRAGQAYIVLGAIDDTGKVLAKIGRKLTSWGKGFQSLGIDTLFKTAFAAGPMAMGLHTFMKFEDLMKQTQARTGATEGQLKELSDTARTVGRDLGLTATQVAAIFAELSTRDFGLADMQSMIRPIALLAKATGSGSDTDMQQSTKLMSISLQAFKMDASEAANIADVLTVAANKSNFALDDLREALANIGPLAHNMGMGFKETVAILAQMRNVEIDAASAGIGLRNILLNSSNTKEVGKFNDRLKTLGETGIEFTDKMGNLKDGATLLFEVFAKLRKFGTGTRASLLEEIFGKRAITAAVAAGSSQESFNNLMRSMEKAGGEAERISHVMESGFGGSFWRKLVTGVHDLAIEFGYALAPSLTILQVPMSQAIVAIKTWIGLNPQLVASITAVVAAIGTMAVGLIVLGTALNIAGIAFSGFGLMWTLLQRSLALVVNLIAGTVSIVYSLAGAFISMSIMAVSAMVGVIGVLIDAMVAVLGFIGVMGSLGGFLAPLAVFIAIVFLIDLAVVKLDLFSKAWNAVTQAIHDLFGIASILLSDLGNIGVFAWKRIGEQAMATGKQMFQSFSLAYDLAKSGRMEQAWNLIFLSLKSGWLDFRNVVLDIFDEIYISIGAMVMIFMAALDIIKTKFVAFLKIMEPIFAAMGIGIAAIIVKLAPGIKQPNDLLLNQFQKDFDDIKKNLRAGRAPGKRARDKEAEQAAGDVIQAQAEAMQAAIEDQFRQEQKPDEKKKIEELLGGGGKQVPDVGGKIPQALEGLEKGSIEAAKAAYENSLQQGEDGIQGEILGAMQEVAANTGMIAENLQVA